MEQTMVRAPRMRIINIATGQSRRMQFNPTQFEEKIGVNYARQQVPGLSHEVLQFINTQNRTFSFDLFFENANFPTAGKRNPIKNLRGFFRSLVYPRRVGGLVGAGAPRVLMVFPAFLSVTAVVVDLGFTYQRLDRSGEPAAMVVTLQLEELREVLRLSEDVQGIDNE